MPSTPTQHEKDVHLISETGKYLRIGGALENTGDFKRAAEAYKHAYSLDRGMRAVSGILLAMTYEKLGQNDEGIHLLTQMIQNGELSPDGINNANEIISRLLAAKQAAAHP